MAIKYIFVQLFFIVLACHVGFAQADENNILGNWTTDKGKIIKVVKQDNQFEGTTLDGASILKDLTFKEDSWKGMIQNRSGSLSAKCDIVMEDENKIKITARKGIFSKHFYWTRAK